MIERNTSRNLAGQGDGDAAVGDLLELLLKPCYGAVTPVRVVFDKMMKRVKEGGGGGGGCGLASHRV